MIPHEPTTSAPAPDVPAAAAPPARAAAFPRPFEAAIVAAIIVLDQLTKWLVRNNLELWESREVIPGLLNLVHVQNTGAAFGLLNNIDFAYKPIVMIAVAALALLAIAAYATQLGFHERAARLGLAFILGGAVGNLIDRALAGHVLDFVDVYWGTSHFWAFNVADAAINVGAFLVILDMFGIGRRYAPDTV
jgi:signal peptidase II